MPASGSACSYTGLRYSSNQGTTFASSEREGDEQHDGVRAGGAVLHGHLLLPPSDCLELVAPGVPQPCSTEEADRGKTEE